MLTRIRNGLAVGKSEVVLPYSRFKEQLAAVLAKNGFLETVTVTEVDSKQQLCLQIQKPDRPSRLTNLTRISKPGRRVYATSRTIPVVKSGRGLVILSTSKGLLTGTAARRARLGGEVICSVY